MPRPQLRGLDRFWPAYLERRGLRHGKDGRYCVLYIVYKGVPNRRRQTGNCQLLFLERRGLCKGQKVEEVVPHRKSYAVYPNMFAVSPPNYPNYAPRLQTGRCTTSISGDIGSPSADNKHML